MGADNTRKSFDPIKHFSRVVMQQGRVQLDADWNEQADIQLHILRRLAAAVFPNGGGGGFNVAPLGNLTNDFIIGAGDRWVDGILCEAESTPVAVTAVTPPHNVSVAAWTVDERAFGVGQYVSVTGVDTSGGPVEVDGKIVATAYGSSTLTLDADVTPLQNATGLRLQRLVTYVSQPGLTGSPLTSGNLYQIYLDVWERIITYLQDASIREVALNGPDTAARTQVVWQVRALQMQPPPPIRAIKGKPAPAPSPPKCLTVQALATSLQPNASGWLQARALPGVESTDPCTIAPDSQYRGPENQLYESRSTTVARCPPIPRNRQRSSGRAKTDPSYFRSSNSTWPTERRRSYSEAWVATIASVYTSVITLKSKTIRRRWLMLRIRCCKYRRSIEPPCWSR